MKTRKKIFLIFSFIFLINLIFFDRGYSVHEINKKLELKENYSHLISFDEKIIRYRIGDKERFNIEILPDIFNSRHEMIVRPLDELNTNLLVWTESRIYNFEIESRRKGGILRFFNFNSSRDKASEKTLSVLGEMDLDLPPYLPQKHEAESFEIDPPPVIK